MTDFEHRLREAAAEGARASRQPGSAELHRRMRRRRHRAGATTAVLVAVVTAAGIHLGTRGTSPGAAPQHSMSSTTVVASSGVVGEAMLVSPVTINPGGSITVTGGDCDSGTPVSVSLGPADKPHALGTVTANRQGAFSGTMRIPGNAPPGPGILWAACKAPNPTGKLLHTASITIAG